MWNCCDKVMITKKCVIYIFSVYIDFHCSYLSNKKIIKVLGPIDNEIGILSIKVKILVNLELKC